MTRGARRRTRLALAVVIVLAMATACGPRRPHEDFVSAARGTNGLRSGEKIAGRLLIHEPNRQILLQLLRDVLYRVIGGRARAGNSERYAPL